MSWTRRTVEQRLTAQVGAKATVGTIERETFFSFSPVIDVRNVSVAEPAWAGTGKVASVGLLRVRVHMVPFLIGRPNPEILSASGVRLNLKRAADGRESWRHKGERRQSGEGPELDRLVLSDTILTYEDGQQRRRFLLNLAGSTRTGLRVWGSGAVDGDPVQVRASGAPARGGWSFHANINGKLLELRVAGSMARPLATDQMHFHVSARADNLKRLDRIIEAGLFGTQRITIDAEVTRSPARWDIQALSGRIGGSAIVDSSLSVRKVDGRSKLDGRVHFARLNFDDLADDAGLAKAAVLEQQVGAKLVPNTRINIRKLKRTDGRLVVTADQIFGGKRPSSITALSGTLVLEDRLLTVSPLRIALKRGAITGKVVVDQRDDAPEPRVSLRLDLANSSVAALAGGGAPGVDAPVDGRVRLEGRGDTIREAIGSSNGMIGIVARPGALPDKIAGLIGFDLGRGLLGSTDKAVGLRCAALRLEIRQGRGTVDPLVVDTSISQSTGQGSISFPDEGLSLSINGAPKKNVLLRLDGPVHVGGTIRAPKVVIPPSIKTARFILKSILHTVLDGPDRKAADVQCGAIIAQALK